MIYLGSRNLAGLSRVIPDSKSASSLYRFVAKMEWDAEEIERVRWEMLNRRTRRALQAAGRRGKTIPVFLAIDDTLVEKSGKQMEGVDYHYSHSLGRTVLGHVWVTGHIVVLGQSYPIGWKMYRRRTTCEELGIPFASKPELAAMILHAFQSLPHTQTYVLTDSWYPSQDLLNLCEACGFHLISAVKADRKFKVVTEQALQKEYDAIADELVNCYLGVARILLTQRNYKGTIPYVRKVLYYDPINEEALEMVETIRKNRITFKTSDITNARPRVSGH